MEITRCCQGYIDDNLNNKLERGRKTVGKIYKSKENLPVTFNDCTNITTEHTEPFNRPPDLS
jgi:hypothetical protein